MSVPPWLSRTVIFVFWAVILGVAGLALALRLGVADPKPLGKHLRLDEFHDLSAWTLAADPGVTIEQTPEGLKLTFSDAGQQALALTPAVAPPFTLEVAGAQIAGPSGLVYGLVSDYVSPESYTAVWLNNHGYAEAFSLIQGAAGEWFQWQQWPHILAGPETNRVRVDADSTGAVVARINDEVLARWSAPTVPGGQVGVAARSRAAGIVLFRWMKLWSEGSE